MKRMNRKGQVFLMAAVIIVGLIFGATRTLNYASAGSEQEAFYDLSEEIKDETNKVIDYGVFSNSNPSLTALDFIGNYTLNIIDEEFIFIYGDFNNVFAVNYETVTTGSVTVATGGNDVIIPIQSVTGTAANVNYDPNTQTVRVRIRNVDYYFDLKEGQNFFILLIKDEDGEKFVAQR